MTSRTKQLNNFDEIKPFNYNKGNKIKNISVTVCIATIYNNNSILAISDRMITGGYGDTTFETQVSKIHPLSNSIAVLMAGDQSIQSQVFARVLKVISEKISANPAKWIDIAEAAKIYSDCFKEIRKEFAENSVLSKYNLNFDSFIKNQNGMKDYLIEAINRELEKFYKMFGVIASLIVGIDETGPHVYVVEGETISCNDMIGFAAIGIGESHALSHLMLSSYSPFSDEPNALLTIHQAKKKAEVSPGVGKATDMCIIGPDKGTLKLIHPIEKDGKVIDVINDLDVFYEKYKKNIHRIDQKTKKSIQKYLNDLVKTKEEKQKPIDDNLIDESKLIVDKKI